MTALTQVQRANMVYSTLWFGLETGASILITTYLLRQLKFDTTYAFQHGLLFTSAYSLFKHKGSICEAGSKASIVAFELLAASIGGFIAAAKIPEIFLHSVFPKIQQFYQDFYPSAEVFSPRY